AGNLCLELFEKYLNEKFGCSYKEEYLYEAADKYIIPIYEQHPWGYSIPYLLSAKNGRNPSYVHYLQSKGLSVQQMSRVFASMKERNVGITYDIEMCDNLIKELFV
ncbi:MAG: hypothetical protein J6U21_05930, partial [Bacteroidales bacterium]|nr:hypothetical protein [Bacteroidales bacterium]